MYVHNRRHIRFISPQVTDVQLQATFDQAATGLVVVNPIGRIIRANRYFAQILGYAPSELAGRPIAELTHPEDRQHEDVVSLSARMSVSPSPTPVERRYVRKDGTAVWVNLAASDIRDSRNERLHVLCVVTDMTLRKRLEEQLRESERRASEHARRLEATFTAVTDGIIIMDAAGRISLANPALRELLELPADFDLAATLPEDRLRLFAMRHPDGSPMGPDEIPTARAIRGERLLGSSNVDEWLRTYRSRDLQLSVTAAPLADDTGEITGAVAVLRDVTERRRLERQTKELADLLKTTFHAMNDAVMVYDRDGRVVRANQATLSLFGIDRDSNFGSLSMEERGRRLPAWDAAGREIPMDRRPAPRVLRGEILRGESEADERIRTLDGREIWTSCSGAPIRDANGTITGAVLVVRDVTERRKLERRAQELARVIETTFDAMSDAVLVYDETGRIIQSNEAVNTILGLDGDTTFASLSLEERSQALLAWDETGRPLVGDRRVVPRLLRGEVLRGESSADERVRTLDGREIWTSNSGAPIRGPDGAIVGAVLVMRDVTERRRLEQRTRDALATIIDTARTLILPPGDGANGDDAAAVADRLAGCVRRVLDPRAATSLLLMRVDGSTTKLLAASGYPPDAEAHIRRHVDGAELKQHIPDPSHLARLRTGEALVLDLTQPAYAYVNHALGVTEMLVVPLRIGHRMIGLLTLNPDRAGYHYDQSEIDLAEAVGQLAAIVVDRARLRREREEAVTQVRALEEAQRRMDEFLGIASHELRTPLTSIKASLQLTTVHVGAILSWLRDQSDGPTGAIDDDLDELRGRLDRAHRLLARSDRHVSRLVSLVSDMLDVSRIQSGRLALRMTMCDLVTLVNDVVEDQRLAAPGRVIHLDVPADLAAPVNADPERIIQVVVNYLANALKYSRPDQAVHVVVSVQAGWVRVDVRDDGAGLSSEQQQHVWERFYRAEGVTVQSGSGLGLGLGLFISRTIVERHDGRVGVESASGDGSTFWFSLPLLSG
jgi:PAS domain S-box-containing protein